MSTKVVSGDTLSVDAVTPAPSDEELVAIVTALELAWPRPVVLAASSVAKPPSAWRFSGRWWSKASR